MSAPTLVIMAAGLGSRFGSPKQLYPVGPQGHTLMEYSAYDAIRAGVNRLVVVVRSESKDRFRRLFDSGVSRVANVELVEQDTHYTLGGVVERSKPWGTGHAVVTVADIVDGPFLVLNADDHYGVNSIVTLVESLSRTQGVGALVGYRLDKTLSESGSVKRGICTVGGVNDLQEVSEYSDLRRGVNGISGVDPNGRSRVLDSAQLTSMNMWGLPASVVDDFVDMWHAFASAFGADSERELFLPDMINELIASHRLQCKVLRTADAWSGLTYHDDLAEVRRHLAHLTSQGVYPSELWGQSRTSSSNVSELG